MASRTQRRARLAATLRSPWLVPAGWLVGIGSAAALVFMPRVTGMPALVVGGLSFVLAGVLVASVLVVAVALVAPAARRAAARIVAMASVRPARSQERSS